MLEDWNYRKKDKFVVLYVWHGIEINVTRKILVSKNFRANLPCNETMDQVHCETSRSCMRPPPKLDINPVDMYDMCMIDYHNNI